MIKEIKYFIFLLIIILFIFFTAKYYFSDSHKKKSYRSLTNINREIQASWTLAVAKTVPTSPKPLISSGVDD